MRKKFRQLSLQAKMSSIFVLANLVVFAVTVILLLGINSMSSEIDKVYQGNLRLNEVSDALMAVQDSMTDYLNSKTSDSLEEFYRNEQTYSQLVQDMSDGVTGATFQRMERSIRHMSEEYLDLVSQTIEAKRGRNVEKYRVRYENATQMYEYINTYIYSLNNEQFRSNSENYSRLSAAFRNFEMVSVIALSIVIVVSVFIVVKLTGEIISPLKDLAVTADEVAGGNFDTELLQVQSEDEIGVVTGAFNQMLISIRQYLESLRESMEIRRSLMEKELLMEAHLKDAQLKYLQAQINPHFLFNTLNAGAQLAMMEGADRTYEYVQNDYDALEDTGSNYHEAADHVDEMMNEFGQKIDELLSVLQNVNTANTQMEATVGDSTEKLSVVEKNNQGLQQEMKDISYAVEELAASAGQLKESIRCFTVV